MVDRRKFLKSSIAAGVTASLPLGWVVRDAQADTACTILGCAEPTALADPAWQFANFGMGPAAFTTPVPNALDPSFIYAPGGGNTYEVGVGVAQHSAGLVDGIGSAQPTMTIYGYGDSRGPTWPGRTFEIIGGVDNDSKTKVRWLNNLAADGNDHFLPVDTSLHWCYSLHGYDTNTIAANGVPIITHLHGGHTDFQFDGNPEFFYNADLSVIGPSWNNVPGGFTDRFRYDNNVMAGTLWYHDHALGITRLNVYAGMAGFYIVRDAVDTGLLGNGLDLPHKPYERAYAIQDRMFTANGQLFVPALAGDPYYDDFITGEGATPPPGQPTAMAEFFGDHMIVNGQAWPVEAVEPRNYRMRLLNGTDSRFMALEFYEVPAGATDPLAAIKGPLDFTVVGSDQGIASSPTTVTRLVSEPGSRYDVVFDFKQVAAGNRVIMKNIGGDEPFGGDIPGPQVFQFTDRVMAFDVNLPLNTAEPDVTPVGSMTAAFGYNSVPPEPIARVRKVALFEGKDEFGRLQPLLGTAEPATDYRGRPVNWPATPEYQLAVMPDGTSSPLVGQMDGAIAWHSPTTENPRINTKEEWEVWNMTGDAHPVHLHLVNFEIIGRKAVKWDSNTVSVGDMIPDGMGGMVAATDDDVDRVIPNVKAAVAAGDGTYLVLQPTVQHNSVAGVAATYGMAFKIMTPTTMGALMPPDPATGYVENAPKDMVTALPDEVTIIQAKFDKKGRYVWHCHILSHEDHEMMRVLHVGKEK
jgi:FtsP/CotA-like multicopper oxidase with cupredoxin domain